MYMYMYTYIFMDIYMYMYTTSCSYTCSRDRGDYFKVVGLKKICPRQTSIRGHRSAIYHAFARHHIYNPTKRNIAVSLGIPSNTVNMLNKAKVSLAVLVARNKLMCDVSDTDTVCSLRVC